MNYYENLNNFLLNRAADDNSMNLLKSLHINYKSYIEKNHYNIEGYVKNGNLLDIKLYLLLNKNKKIDDLSIFNDGILLSAIKYSRYEILNYFLINGIDIRFNNDCLLDFAIIYGQYNMFQYLSKKGLNIHKQDDKLLQLSCEYGYCNIVKYLIENNVVKHLTQAFKKAVLAQRYDVIKYLLDLEIDKNYGINKKYIVNYGLSCSCKLGNLKLVKLFTEYGANIHINNEELLNIAIYYKYTPIKKYLISKGADKNKIIYFDSLKAAPAHYFNYN